MIKDYVAVDLETTGLYPKQDRIIEIGALRVRNGEVVETFSSFINPLQRLTDSLGGRRGGWERPLRALLGPQGSASSGRGGGVRTTGQGTGTAWSREPRSPPSVGTTWRSQKGLAFGLKALTAPPLC